MRIMLRQLDRVVIATIASAYRVVRPEHNALLHACSLPWVSHAIPRLAINACDGWLRLLAFTLDNSFF